MGEGGEGEGGEGGREEGRVGRGTLLPRFEKVLFFYWGGLHTITPFCSVVMCRNSTFQTSLAI